MNSQVLFQTVLAAGHPEGSSFSSIDEIVRAALQGLDGIFLFLILALALVVITMISHAFHSSVKVTMAVLGLSAVVIAIGAVFAWKTGRSLDLDTPNNGGIRAFLTRDDTVQMGPFSIRLDDIDTLKTKPTEDGTDPWTWNDKRFGQDTIRSFLESGDIRLASDFAIPKPDVQALWPRYEEYAATNDPQQWSSMLTRLSTSVESVETGRSVPLRTAFSKWPLAELLVRLGSDTSPLVHGFFPEAAAIPLMSDDGQRFDLIVVAIFNGDRDIGESEACVLKLIPSTSSDSK